MILLGVLEGSLKLKGNNNVQTISFNLRRPIRTHINVYRF